MGETVLLQRPQPCRFAPEDEPFLHGRLDAGDRALQITHHHLRGPEQRVHLTGEEVVDAVVPDDFPHTAVQKDVTGKEEAGFTSFTSFTS